MLLPMNNEAIRCRVEPWDSQMIPDFMVDTQTVRIFKLTSVVKYSTEPIRPNYAQPSGEIASAGPGNSLHHSTGVRQSCDGYVEEGGGRCRLYIREPAPGRTALCAMSARVRVAAS